MPVARVAGGGLDRVGDGVAEVEDLAFAGVALVARDDAQLGQHAGGDHGLVVDRRADPHAVPEPPAGDQGGLEHLGVAGGAFLGRQRAQRRRVDEDPGGLMVGADVVLGLGQVDARLAAVGGVDLGDHGGRNVDDRDPALIRRGAEPGQVADDAAAQRDDVVAAGQARPHELGPDDLGVGDGLGLLARHDAHPARQRLETVAVEPADGAVGDEEAPARAGPGRVVSEHVVAQVDRILRGGRPGPQHAGAGGAVREGLEGDGDGVGRAVEDHDLGRGLVGRLALGMQARERVAVGRQRPDGSVLGDAAPAGVDVDVEPCDEVASGGRAHALGAEGPAAQRDDGSGRRVVEGAGDDDLFAQPERLLALVGEQVGDADAELALDQRVGVEGLHAPRLGRGLGGDALARPHEAREDERAVGQR